MEVSVLISKLRHFLLGDLHSVKPDLDHTTEKKLRMSQSEAGLVSLLSRAKETHAGGEGGDATHLRLYKSIFLHLP